MARPGPRSEAQFRYWDMKRKGRSQSEISREFGITRQAVSKSVKLMEREILYDILHTAGSAGILAEWTEAGRGLLIGISPQLGNVPCVIVVDGQGMPRIFYDPAKNRDAGLRRKVMAELRRTLRDGPGVRTGADPSFKDVLAAMVGRDGNGRYRESEGIYRESEGRYRESKGRYRESKGRYRESKGR